MFKSLIEWDTKYLLKINRFDNKSFSILMKIVSFLGRETIWFTLIATFIFIYYWRMAFISIGLSLMYGIIIIYIMKVIIDRKRPYEDEKIKNKLILRVKKGSSSSFPSWHTYNLCSQIIVIYFYIFDNPVFLIMGLILAAILGYSRIYLGAHYPLDIIIGYSMGFVGFLSVLLTINWWHSLVLNLEEYFGFGKQSDMVINSYFRFPWYWVIVIIVYSGIIFASLYKYLFKN
jgi:membrane-associated phospholipid phosphatase